MSHVSSLESLAKDLIYALRAMRINPAFAATAIFTLALGIGANTTIFTVVHAVLLKPLAYHEPDRLIEISGGATPVRFDEMKSHARFAHLAAFTGEETLTLVAGSAPEVLTASRVSAGFLKILGVNPLLGRGFVTEEDSPGGPPAAIISAEVWQRRFGGDSHIIGKIINLDAVSYTIIGVLPARFQFPFAGLDIWLTKPSEWPPIPPKSRPLSPFLTVFGRLNPGLSLDQANAELAVVQHQYATAHPAMLDAKPKSPVRVMPLRDKLVIGVRSLLWMLFGAVAFVLLIACANVASLLLARASARSREFAIRSALGAARHRLIAQLLVESVLLSSCGGVLGWAVALWSLRAIRNITSFELPRANEIHLDLTVLAFAVALSLVTGVLFGLWPSLGISRPDLIEVLRTRNEGHESVSGAVRASSVGRHILVIAQIALSIILLIGAALLIETVMHLRGDNPGFNPANLLTMRISLPPFRYDTDEKKNAFFGDLIQRVQSLPDVTSATAAVTLPMTAYAGTPVQDANKPPLKLNERLIAMIQIATAGYFRTLEIPLKRGRDFNERDRQGSQRVAIIDENLARRFWPAYPAGLDPIGQRLLIGGTNPQPAQIIGIVANVHQNVENSAWPESVYIAFAQNPLPFAMLAIRTEHNPVSVTTAVRKQVRALDPDQPISTVQTMEELVEAQLGQRRLLMMLLGAFAGVAVILSLVGIYGVIAYSVTQRTHELGIRRALGAQEGDILRLIVGQGFGMALAAVLIGLAGAFALTRVMSTVLFQVSATDPATFAIITVLFLFIALAASYVPARRAAKIDPSRALRSE